MNDTFPIEKWKEQFPFTEIENEHTYFWFSSYEKLPQELKHINQNTILSPKWFANYESISSDVLNTCFLVVFVDVSIQNIYPIQIVEIPYGKLKYKLSTTAAFLIQMILSRSINGKKVLKGMIVGDALLTGTNTSNWDLSILIEGMNWLEESPEINNVPSLQVIKDVRVDKNRKLQNILSGFSPCVSDPEMILHIEDSWKNINDYQIALTKKYRHRFKNSRKKGRQLERQYLTSQEIIGNIAVLRELFQEVLNNQSFALFEEDIISLIEFNNVLETDFYLRVYRINDEIVGFSTAIHNDNTLITHRIGMRYAVNQSHKLYQNILYDHIEHAIQLNCSSVSFGRTAIEIKSAVGAKPRVLDVLIRHRNWFANMVLRYILKNTSSMSWVERNPFLKDKHNTESQTVTT
jgi:hypothetical protein